MPWPDPVAHWGSTEAERAEPFPCDRHLESADQAMFRAIEVDAPQEVVFRWLCQLRAAPYSYDKLDNSYRADAIGDGRSRIVVKLLVAYPRRAYGPLLRLVLPPGDLVMMLRQLLNLKGLAERTAAGHGNAVPAGA
jgi:hypothetical protein